MWCCLKLFCVELPDMDMPHAVLRALPLTSAEADGCVIAEANVADCGLGQSLEYGGQ